MALATPPVIYDRDLVQDAAEKMAEEMRLCTTCVKQEPGPRHFRCGISGSGLIGNSDCGSGSRRYDPSTRSFTGRPHCTCDYCF